jgi:hypothetical protein
LNNQHYSGASARIRALALEINQHLTFFELEVPLEI